MYTHRHTHTHTPSTRNPQHWFVLLEDAWAFCQPKRPNCYCFFPTGARTDWVFPYFCPEKWLINFLC